MTIGLADQIGRSERPNISDRIGPREAVDARIYSVGMRLCGRSRDRIKKAERTRYLQWLAR